MLGRLIGVRLSRGYGLVKKLALLALLVVGTANSSFGGNCQAGSLATYMAPGFTCTVGSLTFSSFSYTGTATNSAPVSAGQITVVPTGTSLLLEGPWTAGAGQSIDSVITYSVTSSGAVITGVDVSMLGLNIVQGGDISVSASALGNGTLLALLNYAQSGGLSTSSSAGFDPVTSAQISTNIDLTGNNGQADLTYVDDQWIPAATTPEPASMLLMGSGLLIVALLWRRRRSRNPSV